MARYPIRKLEQVCFVEVQLWLGVFRRIWQGKNFKILLTTSWLLQNRLDPESLMFLSSRMKIMQKSQPWTRKILETNGNVERCKFLRNWKNARFFNLFGRLRKIPDVRISMTTMYLSYFKFLVCQRIIIFV